MERLSVRDPTDVATPAAADRRAGHAAWATTKPRPAGSPSSRPNWRRTCCATAAAARSWPARDRMRPGAASRSWRWTEGPGMADVAACLRDGYSTGGTSGNGLGAVQRQARADADPFACPARGTACLARIVARWTAAAAPRPSRIRRAVRAEAGRRGLRRRGCDRQRGRTARVGDAARRRAWPRPAGRRGLAGSGAAVSKHQRRQPRADVLAILHAGLRATRGAALATALIDPARAAGHLWRDRQHRRLHHRQRRHPPHGLAQRHRRAHRRPRCRNSTIRSITGRFW